MSDWCTNTATVVLEASPTIPVWNHAPSAGSHRVEVGAMGGVEYPSPHIVDGESIVMVGFAKGVGVGSASGAAEHAARATATSVAVETLRSRFSIPIVAIEPAVKPAAARTRSGVVGVLATTQTLASERFSKLVETHAAGVRVVTQPAPGLVERVEAGELSTPPTRSLVERYVRPLVDNGADTIVLGCTHYPFLSEVIQDVAGSGVTVIDPAVAVAKELRRRLESGGLLAPDARVGSERFWTTGPVEQSQAVMAQLWGSPIEVTRAA